MKKEKLYLTGLIFYSTPEKSERISSKTENWSHIASLKQHSLLSPLGADYEALDYSPKLGAQVSKWALNL